MPQLKVILVGEDPASHVYVGHKIKLARKCGISAETIKLNQTISQEALEAQVIALSKDESVNGILIQLPLPDHINTQKILNLVPQLKDVDGLTQANNHALEYNNPHALTPCTPLGIMRLFEYMNFV